MKNLKHIIKKIRTRRRQPQHCTNKSNIYKQQTQNASAANDFFPRYYPSGITCNIFQLNNIIPIKLYI